MQVLKSNIFFGFGFSPERLLLKITSNLFIMVLFVATPTLAAGADNAMFWQCMSKAVESADSMTTVGDLRTSCEKKQVPQADLTADTAQESAEFKQDDRFTQRRLMEKETEEKAFVMTPHRQNYVLFATHTSNINNAPFEAAFPKEKPLDKTEAMFQISFKFPLATNLFNNGTAFHIAYTQRSFWQVYSSNVSRTFRENNFEPEAFLTFKNNWHVGNGWSNSVNKLGVDHQSNGQREILSRSWNRLYAQSFLINPDSDLYLSLKPWIIVGDKTDNSDIRRYMGNFEFKAVYNYEKQTFGMMTRNNLRADNKGALQLDWSFPLFGHLRAYMQGFHGYGYSLIDYDHSQSVIGFGIELTDYL